MDSPYAVRVLAEQQRLAKVRYEDYTKTEELFHPFCLYHILSPDDLLLYLPYWSELFDFPETLRLLEQRFGLPKAQSFQALRDNFHELYPAEVFEKVSKKDFEKDFYEEESDPLNFLLAAVRTNNLALLTESFEEFPHLRTARIYGALTIATAEAGHLDMTQALIGTSKPDDLNPILAAAARGGSVPLARWLLDRLPYAKLKDNDQAVFNAAERGNLAMLLELKELQLAFDEGPFTYWRAALRGAASGGHFELVNEALNRIHSKGHLTAELVWEAAELAWKNDHHEVYRGLGKVIDVLEENESRQTATSRDSVRTHAGGNNSPCLEA